MKASIIITAYNQAHILPFILESIRSQKTNYEYEVIIADDGSNRKDIENTYKAISNFQDIEIQHVYQQDKGFRASRSRNNAIRLARHDVIITLDGDIVPSDSLWLEKTMNVHIDNKDIVTYTHRKYKEFNEIPLNSSKLKENVALYEIEQEIKNCMKVWQRAWSFNISFRKTEETYFDEAFKYWGLEDGEFTYRLMKQHNYSLHEIDDLNLFHINEDGEAINNPFRTKKAQDMLNFINNAIYFYKKYNDDEIMQTFNTIPNYETFAKDGFDLSETVLSKQRQSLSNLEEQKKLYENHIKREG